MGGRGGAADSGVVDEQTIPSTPPAAGSSQVPAGSGAQWSGTRFPARVRGVRARRRGQGGAAVRDRVVQVRLTAEGFAGVDARAARARLGLGAWVALLGEDVALDRPALSAGQLEAVGAAGDRLRRAGGVLNTLAVGENIGRAVPEEQLGPVLARVSEAVGNAERVLAEVAGVYAQAAAAGAGETAVGAGRRGRRAADPDVVGVRDRRVGVRLSAAEHEALAGAAAAAGLAVGAWLGALVEDPADARPAITGEAWGAVFGLRRGLRGVGTNLAQIQAARAARGAEPLPALHGAIAGVDAAIRASLQVADVIATAGGRGVAG